MSQNTNVTEYVTAGGEAQEAAPPLRYRARPGARCPLDGGEGAAPRLVGRFSDHPGGGRTSPHGVRSALRVVCTPA